MAQKTNYLRSKTEEKLKKYISYESDKSDDSVMVFIMVFVQKPIKHVPLLCDESLM